MQWRTVIGQLAVEWSKKKVSDLPKNPANDEQEDGDGPVAMVEESLGEVEGDPPAERESNVSSLLRPIDPQAISQGNASPQMASASVSDSGSAQDTPLKLMVDVSQDSLPETYTEENALSRCGAD